MVRGRGGLWLKAENDQTEVEGRSRECIEGQIDNRDRRGGFEVGGLEVRVRVKWLKH